MIAEIQENYTKQALLNSEKHENIYDVFDDLLSKVELFSSLNYDENKDMQHCIYMYVEDLKDHIKGLEYQLKREIIEGTLKV